MTAPTEERRAELVTALGDVRRRVAEACAAAGRDPHAVSVIAVTKTYPATDVATLAGIGVTEFGESRDQEASVKVAEVRALVAAASAEASPSTPAGSGAATHGVEGLRWHFVGRLQTNKARRVVEYVDVVHSVDRAELATALADAVARAERAPLAVFLQVSLDADPQRGGVPRDGVAELAELIANRPELDLRGVMAVVPLDAEPGAAFGELAAISAELTRQHPNAAAISAGMSSDFELAIRHGATHLRVGTALLGRRRAVLG
jgi:PLP dependent protein